MALCREAPSYMSLFGIPCKTATTRNPHLTHPPVKVGLRDIICYLHCATETRDLYNPAHHLVRAPAGI